MYHQALGVHPSGLIGPPGALKSTIWRRFSIDFCRIRAPMRGHRKMACFPHFSPHDRSKKGNAIGKQSRRSIDAKRSLSECSMDHPSTARSEERWDRTFMVSVDTDDGAAHGAFGAFPGPKTRDVQGPEEITSDHTFHPLRRRICIDCACQRGQEMCI